MENENVYFQNVPIGAVVSFAMKEAPAGWLVCDGEMYSKELFPLLSETLGTKYNHPDTPGGFFCVPDLQGLFVRGWDKDGNRDGGRKFASIQEDALQGHKHDIVVDVGKIHTETAGGHFHYIGCHKYPTYERDGLLSTTYHHEHVCSYDSNDKSENKSTDRDGAHTHAFKIENGFVNISNAATSSCGIIRIDKETRPQNIALLYCIKAENLPAPDKLAETGYSTIVEKVKKELMSSVLPLSRSLPIVVIGGEDYLANIEKIKQSHFISHPANRQDLVYATAQCFNDICVYNVRNGQRSEQFDAFGLDLLVSWIIDKGMLAQKEKLLFIEEVKNYISSLLLAITPK
jgi:microcystin-dependent protein